MPSQHLSLYIAMIDDINPIWFNNYSKLKDFCNQKIQILCYKVPYNLIKRRIKVPSQDYPICSREWAVKGLVKSLQSLLALIF